jgi:hypothetical protein
MLHCPIGGSLSGTVHILKKNPLVHMLCTRVFFCGEFSPADDKKKKKRLANPTKEF